MFHYNTISSAFHRDEIVPQVNWHLKQIEEQIEEIPTFKEVGTVEFLKLCCPLPKCGISQGTFTGKDLLFFSPLSIIFLLLYFVSENEKQAATVNLSFNGERWQGKMKCRRLTVPTPCPCWDNFARGSNKSIVLSHHRTLLTPSKTRLLYNTSNIHTHKKKLLGNAGKIWVNKILLSPMQL